MTRLRPLVGYDLAGPPTWGPLPLDPQSGDTAGAVRRAVGELAADLTSGPEAASRCEQVLLRAQPGYVDQGHQAVFVWVADPEDGTPTGVLVVELLVHDTDDGVARADAFEQALPPASSRPEVVRQDVVRERVPAGEAVVVSALGADQQGDLEESLTFVVFPDGATDALELSFATGGLHLADLMVADARTIVETLRVTLEGDG